MSDRAGFRADILKAMARPTRVKIVDIITLPVKLEIVERHE